MGVVLERHYTKLQKEIISKLAEIEQQDQNACNGCGGEDCICCDIYVDRLKWKDSDELFDDMEDVY